MTVMYVNWDSGKVKLTWMPDVQITDHNCITSVHGFCFYQDQLLLVNLHGRGWDIPGGHVELNETAEASFRREAMEEGYVEGKCDLLGAVEISHEENPNWEEDSPYPKIGYQLFYRMDIENIYPFASEYESVERILIRPEEVSNIHHDWHDILDVILRKALSESTLSKQKESSEDD